MENVDEINSIGIAIVTFNNLPLLQKCFTSWRNPKNCQLTIFDNGSNPEVVDWLKAQPIDHLILSKTNRGLCYARNRLIEWFRDQGKAKFVLLADSDVRFHDYMVDEMLRKILSDKDIGIVGYSQANKGFPESADGRVEEIANECQLTRLAMWNEIGLFPESLQYYSGDSWKSTIANMHGWKTVLIQDKEGYDHFQHGSQVNPGVKTAMYRDVEYWQEREANFIRYWKTRMLLGKGNQFRNQVDESNSDELIKEVEFDKTAYHLQILTIGNQEHTFSTTAEIEALLWLSKSVHGNLMEIGCHEGLTAMQLAFNNPMKMVYAIDYSGKDLELRPEQICQQPDSERVGYYLKPFKNTHVIDDVFDRINFDLLGNVEFVYYDADTTYPGVKRATEKILEYFQKHPTSKSRLIAWNHYYSKREATSTPSWEGVGDYIRKELARNFQVQRIQGTRIAFLQYPPNG